MHDRSCRCWKNKKNVKDFTIKERCYIVFYCVTEHNDEHKRDHDIASKSHLPN